PAPRLRRELLLDRDSCADVLEDGLRLLRGLLVDLLQDSLRCAVHQVLGLLKAQTSQRPHFLDHLNLLVAGGLENDVELVLLLGLGRGLAAGSASRARRGHRDGSGRLDVKGLLELLYELRQLDQRHLLERVEKACAAELRHGSCSSSSCSRSYPGVRPLGPAAARPWLLVALGSRRWLARCLGRCLACRVRCSVLG